MNSYGIQSITYNPPTAPGTAPAQTQDPQSQEKDFLQLLISEVSDQSPDSPMDPTQMITQYSQLEASIAISKLNATTSAYQNSALASGLMHQQVKISVGGQGSNQTVQGQVTAVDFSGDTPMLTVNGSNYSLLDVVHVGES
jgi:flagellar hook assembly protein FlgD